MVSQSDRANTTVDRQVTITFFTFNSIHSVIMANLKSSTSQNSAGMSYNVDTDSDGSKMAFSFPGYQRFICQQQNIEVSYLKTTIKQQFNN